MKILICLIRISIFVTLLPLTVPAFQYENQPYLPLTRQELHKRFAVKYVGTLSASRPGYFEQKEDKPLPPRLDIGISGASVSATENEGLLISGQDKANRNWSVNLGEFALSYACRFYIADLDRNGIRDVVLVFPTGGNGLAPSSHLFSLTFDARGRPVSFEADGYFQGSLEGIFDLVDLDRDGRAELIYMDFDDGYWITNLYQVRDARWQIIKGQHAGHKYPLFTRFTFTPNRRVVAPRRGRHPVAADLSNNAPVLQGRLISYQWANVSSSEDILLTVETREGKIVLSRPVSWYASFAVVLDNREGRRITSLAANEDAVKQALNEVIEKRYEVTLYGRRRTDISSPELLWARPK
jgi:hypothetical protein